MTDIEKIKAGVALIEGFKDRFEYGLMPLIPNEHFSTIIAALSAAQGLIAQPLIEGGGVTDAMIEAAAKGLYGTGNADFGDATWEGAAREIQDHYRAGAKAALEAVAALSPALEKEGVVDGWNTNAGELAKAVKEFETALPGFWWSVGQCSVGAHASCAVDGNGVQWQLLKDIEAGHPFDAGFHCDTIKGSPAQALHDVMEQALAALSAPVSVQGEPKQK